MSFNGKVVLVTGASSGIGAAIAILFAKEGAKVAIVGRNQNKLDNVKAEIENIGEAPLVLNADISEDDEGKRIIDETIERFGKLDVLVNNAGFSRDGCLKDGDMLQSYDAIMTVNVRAVINISSHAVPHLEVTKGNIVNISSAASMTLPKTPYLLPYYISKAALDKFTQGTALELASSGIRVNSVNPGPVVTDFAVNSKSRAIPIDMRMLDSRAALKRVSEPEEIAELTLFLASDKAKGITGSLYTIDNGALLV